MADRLSESDLRAFEIRGIQKLHDLAALIEIIGDETYDSKLRDKAKQHALGFFANDSCPVMGMACRKYLGRVMGGRDEPLMNIQHIKVISPFTLFKDGQYTALIGFQMSGNNEMQASLVAQRTRKQFGTEEEEVWTVYVCEIKKS